MSTTRTAFLTFCLLSALASVAGAQAAGPGEETLAPALQVEGPWVVRVFVTERAKIDEIATWADVWAVEPEDGYLLAMVDAAGFQRLAASGFHATAPWRRPTPPGLAHREVCPASASTARPRPCTKGPMRRRSRCPSTRRRSRSEAAVAANPANQRKDSEE